jgi:hypothetical protein
MKGVSIGSGASGSYFDYSGEAKKLGRFSLYNPKTHYMNAKIF